MALLKKAAFTLLSSLLLLSDVQAQSPRGSLRGSVQDVTGARIANATIVAQSSDSSLRREANSEDRGEFRIDDLLPGRYRIVVSAPGFSDAVAEVPIAVSSVREITVTLRPAASAQSVTVKGQSSSITTEPIDVASAVHQGVIGRQDLQNLPLAARSFANIAYLAPGTEPVEPSDPTKARITAVATGGSSGLNNELSVDGGDNSDDFIGGFLQNFSPETIQEFAMRTANEDADTGGTTAGSVVITTRRGSNEWHGDAAFYHRAAALNARFPIENPAPDPKQPFSRQNYVGTLGGPIVKERLWFFSSLEYVHENSSIAYSPSSQAEFNALAQLAREGLISTPVGAVNSMEVPSSVPVPFRDYLAMARLDWAPSPSSQWFLRAAVDNYLTRNALVQQAALPSTGATSHDNYMSLVVGHQYVFGPNWVGSFVFNASGLHLTATRNANLGFALAFPFTSTLSTISGVETFGDNQFFTPITAFPVLRNQEKYQIRYDLSHAQERHAPRWGVNFTHEPVLSGALAATAEYVYSPPQDPSFYLSTPGQLAAILSCNPNDPQNQPPNSPCPFTPFTPAGDGSFRQNVQRLGIYAQDSWRVTPHLTINYGLRYDTTFGLFEGSKRTQLENPTFLTLKALQIPLINGAPHDYRKQFGPRLGIAYSPGQNERTVVRAG